MADVMDVSMALQKQDVSALMAQMQRNSETFKRSLPSSVKFAAWAVADALRTATEVSAKKRKITEVKGARTKTGNKTFEVERYSKGRKTTFLVYAHGKREANKLPQVKIALRGLAGKTWNVAQRKLGSGRGGPRVGAGAERIAQRHANVTKRLSGVNPSVTITNSLDYATAALKGTGEQTLNNVMERAARRMEKVIDGKLAKAMKAK